MRCEILLVEGAGGLLAPLGDSYYLLDIVSHLKGEVIVVARNRLGTINHALLTLRALETCPESRPKVVLMGCKPADFSARTNAQVLGDLRPSTQVLEIEHLGSGASGLLRLKENAKKIKKSLARLCG